MNMNANHRMIIYLTCSFICLCVNPVTGDPPSGPPPPPSGGHGSAMNSSPPGAPIDGGLGILLVLGAALAACSKKRPGALT
jgi:hypothetical protein